jgi:hypothetical protein
MTTKNTRETMDAWKQLVDEQVKRVETLHAEMARWEKQGLEQMQTAIDEVSRLMKDSLAQAARLSAEWRQASLQATHQVNEALRGSLQA